MAKAAIASLRIRGRSAAKGHSQWCERRRRASVSGEARQTSLARSSEMKIDYLKFVQWSDADRLLIGYCPDLFIGGACHGSDEQKVYRQLSRLVAQEIAESEKARRALPKRQALVTVPVAV